MKKIMINSYDLEKIPSRMKKTFGTIPKGQEDQYAFILSAMEGNLLKLHRQDPNRMGRQAITAVQMALLTIDGYIKQVENDFSNHTEPENQALLHGLLMSFDPYTNKEIHEFVGNEDGSFDAKNYFAVPIKCLIRIENSIRLWTKERGSNGYFTFIENQIGKKIAQDDKMNFTVLTSESTL